MENIKYHFQGRIMSSSAPENGFSGAGEDMTCP
jgi:hypothetical protein